LAAENALMPQLMEELLARVSCRAIPQPQSTSALTGRAHVEELLAGNSHSFRNVARMDKATFHRLVNLMRGAGLNDTPHISLEEKLLIHIQVCRGWTNRDIAQRFQHSGFTISKIVIYGHIYDGGFNYWSIPETVNHEQGESSTLLTKNA